MADVVDPLTRSRMMAGIRGTNTKPELAVRKGLHALGFRYRIHAKELPGRPDILMPRYRAALFVHGCFWHGHDCALFRMPASRTEFWAAKIENNRQRDLAVKTKLGAAGWRQLTIWECAFRGPEKVGLPHVLDAAANWITAGGEAYEIRGTV